MDTFIPFIHKPEKKKKEEMEPQPLYIELIPDTPSKEEEQEEQRVIIIELM